MSPASPAGLGGRASASFSPRLVATIFSPAPSMKIPEIEIEPPATRTTPLASTPARAMPSTNLWLLSSVPIGPAKRALPPRRATATAALAAQPPVVATRSRA